MLFLDENVRAQVWWVPEPARRQRGGGSNSWLGYGFEAGRWTRLNAKFIAW
jgi:hypothetical protein